MIWPTLLRPHVLSFRNYWRKGSSDPGRNFRDLIVLSLLINIVLGIYYGGQWILQKLDSAFAFAYFHPTTILGIILMFTFLFLLVANISAALSSLFLSRGLEQILASPLSGWQFFFGKLLEIALESSWMIVILIVPLLGAFAAHYGSTPGYYILSLLALLPMCLIGTAIAIILSMLFATFVPANRTREVFYFLGIVVAASLYFIIGLLLPQATQAGLFSTNGVFRIFGILTAPNTYYSPIYWTSVVVGESLLPSGLERYLYLALLWSTAITLCLTAFLLTALLYDRAFTKAQSLKQGVEFNSRNAQQRVRILGKLLGLTRPERAFLAKEFRLFFRDISQASQSLLLLGLSAFYVVTLKFLHTVDVAIPGLSPWAWGVFLVLSNAAVEAFIITAIATRFVFPSVSLEGESYWTAQSSPLELQEFLRIKFRAWLWPVSIFTSVVFTLGAISIGFEPVLVAAKLVATIAMSYGIVGLAIGVGAYFANFEWEHPSQLAAGFGTLVFMLIGFTLILVNLAVVWVSLSFVHSRGGSLDSSAALAVFGSALAIVLYINYTASKLGLRLGTESLRRRME